MNLFINDVPVRLLKADVEVDASWYTTVINAEQEPIIPGKLFNNVWVKNAHMEDIDRIIGLMNNASVSLQLTSLTLSADREVLSRRESSR